MVSSLSAVAVTILTVGHDGLTTGFELEPVIYFVSQDVHLHSVIHLDGWVVVADSASIVRHDVWDCLPGERLFHYFAVFELGLFSIDGVELETALDVVHNTEAIHVIRVGHGRFGFTASDHI